MFRKERAVLFLHELLKDWPCRFIGETFKLPIQGVTEHSQRVKPGFLFIARKGNRKDGAAFIEEAVRRGAAAIIVDRDFNEITHFNLPIIIVPDCRTFLAYVSARLAGNPSERLKIIAVTGTNGKTTVTHFIGQLLYEQGVKAAVIGTLGLFIDGVHIAYQLPKMTTLPAEYLHPLLRKCEREGVTHIVMEASSIGLSTNRLDYCEIDLGLLLNVSEDHYDEHGSKEAYIQAKKKIGEIAKELIVNCDDAACMEMVENLSTGVIYFGESEKANYQLLLQEEESLLQTPTGQYHVEFHMKEHFNRMNVIAAVSALSTLFYPMERIKHGIERLALPEGRMQRIEKNGVTIIIDYAHTPDALKMVLQTIENHCEGEIIAVFGCGGNRDRGKRRKMGEVAGRYATKVIVTSDNPRDEEPLGIINEIIKGVQLTSTPYYKDLDRAAAIRYAITIAGEGDTILIAGKGHEKTQEIKGEVFDFSDVAVAKMILSSFSRKKLPPQ